MHALRFTTGTSVALIAALSTACAALASGASDPAVRRSLAGNWLLNVRESSDTTRASVRGLERGTAAIDEADRAATRPAGRRRLRAARVEGELAARVLAAARSQIEQLAIADSAGTITLRTSDRRHVVVTPGGGSSRLTWLDGTTGVVRARWVEQRLEIARRLDGDIAVQEYYARSPDAARLVVFTVIRGPFDGEITVRRVYDRGF